jgi:hypothetical protein
MEMIIGIATGTPVWVWVVFAYGIYTGIKALGERRVSLKTMILLPGVFLFLSVPSLVGIVGQNPLVALVWGLCLLAGLVLGWYLLTPEPVSVDRTAGTLVVPGTWTVLVLFVTIFTVKFVYGFEQAVNPELAAQPGFLLGVFALSGLSTGIVIGRTAKNYYEFSQAAMV